MVTTRSLEIKGVNPVGFSKEFKGIFLDGHDREYFDFYSKAGSLFDSDEGIKTSVGWNKEGKITLKFDKALLYPSLNDFISYTIERKLSDETEADRKAEKFSYERIDRREPAIRPGFISGVHIQQSDIDRIDRLRGMSERTKPKYSNLISGAITDNINLFWELAKELRDVEVKLPKGARVSFYLPGYHDIFYDEYLTDLAIKKDRKAVVRRDYKEERDSSGMQEVEEPQIIRYPDLDLLLAELHDELVQMAESRTIPI